MLHAHASAQRWRRQYATLNFELARRRTRFAAGSCSRAVHTVPPARQAPHMGFPHRARSCCGCSKQHTHWRIPKSAVPSGGPRSVAATTRATHKAGARQRGAALAQACSTQQILQRACRAARRLALAGKNAVQQLRIGAQPPAVPLELVRLMSTIDKHTALGRDGTQPQAGQQVQRQRWLACRAG